MSKALTVALFCVCIATAFAQAPASLAITTSSLEPCVVDQPCFERLQASGGTPPLQWHTVRGSLAPGLQFDPASGTISGNATAAGEYEVLIEVTDSSKPPQKASRLLKTKSLPPLTVDWKKPPALQATAVGGSLAVSNNGDSVLDLTVIVVAVNEVGKAFALGYQHFNLAAKTTNQEIPFELQLPAGRYTVRADAIGEVASRQRIYRAAREAGPFQVPAQ